MTDRSNSPNGPRDAYRTNTSLPVSINRRLNDIVETRLNRADLDQFEPGARKAVEESARRLPRALMHPALQRIAQEPDPEIAATLTAALTVLFGHRGR